MIKTNRLKEFSIKKKSKIIFHDLNFRKDKDEYVAWREGDDNFFVLPEIGQEIIDLLQKGKTINEVEVILETKYNAEVDLLEFIAPLKEIGFIKSIDGKKIASQIEIKYSSLPSVKKKHVSWLVGKKAGVFYLSIFLAAGFVIIGDPSIIPKRSDFFWTESISLVIIGNVVMGLSISFLHEVAHLFAARAVGAGGKISFGTRLHHLVMQTDVSGVWAAGKTQRYRVYLAGSIFNILVASICILLIGFFPIPDLGYRLLKVVILISGLSIVWQFALYMRTDLYFVLLDLLNCRNLFHDSMSYFLYIISKAVNRLVQSKKAVENPLLKLPMHERKSVRVYVWIAVIGSLISLSSFAYFGIPIAIYTYFRAINFFLEGLNNMDWILLADGAVTIIIEGVFMMLFVMTFVKNHKVPIQLRRFTLFVKKKITRKFPN